MTTSPSMVILYHNVNTINSVKINNINSVILYNLCIEKHC